MRASRIEKTEITRGKREKNLRKKDANGCFWMRLAANGYDWLQMDTIGCKWFRSAANGYDWLQLHAGGTADGAAGGTANRAAARTETVGTGSA